MNELTLSQPDDWHCHFRDGSLLSRTVPDIAQQFARAIVMPNTLPAIITVADAQAYLSRIQQHIPADCDFQPLMTLYLTEDLTPKDIMAAHQSGIITAVKLYPAGATTHSDAGINDLTRIYPLFETMQHVNMPLLIHGEVTDPNVDMLDREGEFVTQNLATLVKEFPSLRMVLEHVSTKTGVDFVTAAPNNIAATITPHHLLLNRQQLQASGNSPHHYCLPIIKSDNDQGALIQAAISGNPKFFLGTDSAPHSKAKKENSCPAAGIYNAPTALAIYADIFATYKALDKLAGFSSVFGAQFYQLPINQKKITLVKKPWQVPTSLAFGDETVIPFMAGETLNWQLAT